MTPLSTTYVFVSFYLLPSSIYIYVACVFVCLFVYLYPINVKTVEQIGPKFCVGHHKTPGKV